MSAWHRENPELSGTDADPWMIHESYRKAVAQPGPPRGMPSIAWLEENSTHKCDPEFGCGEVQAEAPKCRDCGGPLTEREP